MYNKNDLDRVLRKAVIVNIISLTALLAYQICEVAVKALILMTFVMSTCYLISIGLNKVIRIESREAPIKYLDQSVYETVLVSFMSLIILIICDSISEMTGIDITIAFFFVVFGGMLAVFIINKIVLRAKRKEK